MDEPHASVIEALLQGRIDAAEAARKLNRSVRQVYRIKARARSLGTSHLSHGNRGRAPSNKISAETWEKVIELASTHYAGVSSRELQELLRLEHRILVGRESLRKRLRALGIPSKKKINEVSEVGSTSGKTLRKSHRA